MAYFKCPCGLTITGPCDDVEGYWALVGDHEQCCSVEELGVCVPPDAALARNARTKRAFRITAYYLGGTERTRTYLTEKAADARSAREYDRGAELVVIDVGVITFGCEKNGVSP